MKKLLFVLLAVTLLFGCAGLQFTENQDFAVKKIARIAGITLALEKPGEIEKALTYVEYLEDKMPKGYHDVGKFYEDEEERTIVINLNEFKKLHDDLLKHQVNSPPEFTELMNKYFWELD